MANNALLRAVGTQFGTSSALYLLLARMNARASNPVAAVGFDAIFRPNFPSSGNAFQTEAELLAAISGIVAPRVGVDLSNGNIPPVPYVLTQTWMMRQGSISSIYPNTGVFELQVPEGVQIVDLLAARSGIGIRFLRTATPGLISTLPPGVPKILSVTEGATVINDGTFPAVDVAANDVFVVSCSWAGGLRLAGAMRAFVRVAANGLVIGGSNFATSMVLSQGFCDNWVEGPVNATVGYAEVDASFVAPALPNFFGTENLPTFIDRSEGVTYNPTLVGPDLGANNVQDMLDILKVGGPYVFGADALALIGATQFLRAGSGVATVVVGAPASAPGVRIARDQILSHMFASHRGSPANAGLTITYDVLLNGVPMPGASVTLPADQITGATPVGPFSATANVGDEVHLRTTLSAPLVAAVDFAEVTLGA